MNSGSVGTITNSGTITGLDGNAIVNYATIGSLSNTSTGTLIANSYNGIYNGGTITTLNNQGTITTNSSSSGLNNGLYNGGTITTLTNGGTLTGGPTGGAGLYNSGTITTLNNTNRINGFTGLSNTGTIGTLNNSGIIIGSIAALINTSSQLGTITNSGSIAGTITNTGEQALTINGGTGSTFGLLTGSNNDTTAIDIGQITSTSGNVIFGSGNQLLNDNINVGSHTVSNLGTLQVNNTINITGNYSQGANANLILGVASNAVTTGNASTDSGYGRLVVSGNANVASGSSVSLQQLGSYGFAQGQRYVVIQANSTGTNYNEDTLHYSAAGYNVAGATVVGTSVVNGSNTDLLLTLGVTTPATSLVTTPSSPITLATTPNAISSLNGLLNYQGLDPNLMNVFNAAAAIGSTSAGNSAGAQLSPAANLAAATQGSVSSTLQVLNVTAAHVDSLRLAENGNTASGIATGESANTSGLWGQAFGGTSRMDESSDIAGYHSRYNGLLIGADGMVNDSWRAGGLFSYTKTTVNNDGDNDGSSADVKSYGLFGYASYTANPWYLDLSAGAVQHQYDTEREVDFTGVNGIAKGSHNGMQYTAAAQAGYPIDLGAPMANIILTPIAGLSYSTLRQDSYTESGGAGTALHVDANNLNSLKSDLGTKLERAFATQYGSLTPSAQLTWRHEYRDSALQSVANFSADTAGATSFSSTGPKAVEDTGVLSLGLTLVTHKDLTVAAHYTGETGGGFNANTGDLQVRWTF